MTGKIIAREKLVSAFASENNFVAGSMHGLAQSIPCCAVRVVVHCLSLSHCVNEHIREIHLCHRHRAELCANMSSGCASARALIKVRMVKRYRECSHSLFRMPPGQPKHGRGIHAATQVAADGHVSSHAQSHRFVQE